VDDAPHARAARGVEQRARVRDRFGQVVRPWSKRTQYVLSVLTPLRLAASATGSSKRYGSASTSSRSGCGRSGWKVSSSNRAPGCDQAIRDRRSRVAERPR
jgi:hypothetical protein